MDWLDEPLDEQPETPTLVVVDPEEDDDEPVPGQETMFGTDDSFRMAYQEWAGMPEYRQEDLRPYASLTVNFANEADQRAFYALVDQSPMQRLATRSIWYPKMDIGHYFDKRYRDANEAEA